jgi:hypothetical protein
LFCFAGLVVVLAGVEFGEHGAGSGHRLRTVVERGASALGVVGGGFIDVWDRCLEWVEVVGVGQLVVVVVGEVGFVVDFAVGVFGGLLGLVGGHPFRGSGVFGGVPYSDPSDPELHFCSVGFFPGAGGGQLNLSRSKIRFVGLTWGFRCC